MTLKASTLADFPDITADSLLGDMVKVQEMGVFRNRLKCSPEAYIAIKDYFIEEEMKERLRLSLVEETGKWHKFKQHYNPEPPVNFWGTIYGIDIVLDPDLKPGEYRFE